MSEFKRTTKKTIAQHLRNLADFCEGDNKDWAAPELAKWFNEQMDELCSQDFFGTESQCDPRGDHRD
jgi:hypothetical protein